MNYLNDYQKELSTIKYTYFKLNNQPRKIYQENMI